MHFAIPVLNKAGRGLPFAYNLSYDSSIWTPVTSSGVTTWQPDSNWGWIPQTDASLGRVTESMINIPCRNPLYPPGLEYLPGPFYSNYVYRDAFNVSHPFNLSIKLGACGQTSPLPATAVATDGSGYTISTSGLGGTITARTGKVINPTASAEDTNGNEITVNSSGQFFDTLSSTTPVLTLSSAAPPSATTFTYAAPSGSNAVYSMNYQAYTVATNFGVSGITEYGPLSNDLVSSIALPDGSSYTFAYEKTPGSCAPLSGTYLANCTTGRIASVTLPTGGTITYTYNGGSNGIESDGSTAGLTRTLNPGGEWQYSRSLVGGSAWQTTVVDPNSNNTVINFVEDGNTTATYNFYETQRLVYQGGSTGTPLSTTITCYNGKSVSSPSNCYDTAASSPILRTTVFTQLPNASGLQSETDSTLSSYGLRTEVDDYAYGSGQVGLLIRKTITTYASLGNGIQDHASTVTIEDSGNNIKASTTYTYDAGTPTPTSGTPQHIAISGSRGNLTSVAAQANGATTLYRTYTYYDTGNLSTSTDVSTSSGINGAQTTYNYSSTGSCGNSFVTSITEPLSLSRSTTWNCTGGVLLSLADENGNTSSTAYSGSNYSNLFWRPYSSTDNAGNTTNYFYYLNSSNQQFQTENKYAITFNSGNSIVDVVTTHDGFGRPIFGQTKQGPSATNYDTVATCYDSSGRKNAMTLPYSAALITSNTQSCSGAQTDYTYDALNRTESVSDSGGGLTSYSYNENDVLQTLTSPTQAKQQEYDALGRLTSVCEVTSGTAQFPGVSCKQNTSASGYLTQYSYDVLGDRTNVTQNAQASSGYQTRAYVFDMLGRLTSETNPEMNNSAITYSYDSLSSDASCGTITSAGNMLKRLDAAGNATCYSGYDAYHRVESIIYPSTNTPAKNFVYDTATVNGTNMANAKTHLAEAYTCIGTCSSKITDLGFSYSSTGQTSGVWELTPNSGINTYYYVSSLYWPNGAINTLSNLSGLPTITYSTEGEGRMSTVTATSSQSPVVSSITYDPSSHVTALTLGSSDSDSFNFDPNTGRMTKYTYSVGSPAQTDIGNLQWNSNGTLEQLAITDQLNPADSQTCNYTHDALGRVASANCGASTWSQTFSYDPFGNITKTVPGGSTGTSFQPSYDYTNNTNRITSSPFSYISTNDPNGKNGNMTADNSHAYSWDTENKLTGIDAGTSSGICLIYDALGRVVEQDKGSACTISPTGSTEVVYSPSGAKLALMNGSSLVKAFVRLPGGAQAVYNSSGLQYYRHADWLGSSRLATTSSRTLYYSGAYAPFGENYVPSGTQDLSFTGQNQDTEPSGSGGAGGLYDFLYRKHSPVQGRWLSPDPAGLAAVNPADPQSWNRYAYVGNRPLKSVDSLGLIGGSPFCDPDDPDCGYCDPDDPDCGYCDYDDPLCWWDGPFPRFPIPPLPVIPPSPNGPPPGLTELPSGQNSPLNLGDLLSQTPGTECDFGLCLPGGNPFVGVDDAAEIGLCVVNPIACGIIFTGAVIAYEIWIHRQTQTVPSPRIDEACELFASKYDGASTECFYTCSQLGELCQTVEGKCPRVEWSYNLVPCQ
ncbi:MAG: RHS repeat-associated core domain-containing protein [Terriglobales bacterium]